MSTEELVLLVLLYVVINAALIYAAIPTGNWEGCFCFNVLVWGSVISIYHEEHKGKK